MSNPSFSVRDLIVGLCAAAVAGMLLWSFSGLGPDSALILTVFNLLFATLIFPLKGSFMKKLLMLSVADIVGWLWNYYFRSVITLVGGQNDSFTGVYALFNPLVNLLWIIPFWSLSLTLLARPKTEIGEK